MKSNNMPTPKSICKKEAICTLPAKIICDEGFEKACDAFCGYAESVLGTKIRRGSGGIELTYDEKLEKEEYFIDCGDSGIKAAASTPKGMNNALSYLLNILSYDGERLSCKACSVKDKPDAPIRTFMLETARYPHDIKYLYKYVDLCYMNRLSYFQIHFNENQNFTIELPNFPKLKGKYSKEELCALAEYAESRGITIIPEIDVPGHTAIMTKTYPEIFGKQGVMAASEETFSALESIYAYVHEIFPNSPYIHIGGDEASIGEWEKCETTQAYMKEHGIESVHELYAEYIRRVSEIIFGLGCTPIVWEGFSEEYNDRISKEVIVVAWESYYQTVDKLAKSGFKVINASWVPLYIVAPDVHRSTDEIMNWNIRTWRHWWEKSRAYPDGIVLPESEGDVLGAYLCAWGDKFVDAENPEELCKIEYDLVSERMPAFSERTWNSLKKQRFEI